MLLLGFLVIAVGAAIILAGLFTTGVSSSGQIDILGIDISLQTLFVLGVIGAATVLWGLWIIKYGAKRQLRQRREQKKLGELSKKLDRAEAGRNRDLDGDDDPDRRF